MYIDSEVVSQLDGAKRMAGWFPQEELASARSGSFIQLVGVCYRKTRGMSEFPSPSDMGSAGWLTDRQKPKHFS